MKYLRKFADYRKPHSFAAKCRQKRFAFFRTLLDAIPRPLKLLDVGGTPYFWEEMGLANEEGIAITLLNSDPAQLTFSKQGTQFEIVEGNACHMPQFSDQSFDLVYSNSVIEHVGDYHSQQQMMQEICRIGKQFFVQTPNYYFPIEPHFLMPCFQFLPISWRIFLLRHVTLGWKNCAQDPAKAERDVRSIQLLTQKQFQALCPDAKLYKEELFGLTKSFVLYG
ncbi:MAG: class I SAM-dependent methyltransferase [Chlamydiia bacterium]|nr:class I SAM-dependent methyltransferase [Chlamydiia bacterium]